MTYDGGLPFLQTVNWTKILFGLIAAVLGLLYAAGSLPLTIVSQYTVVIGIGLYWLGLNVFVNGVFTDADKYHRLSCKMDDLSTKLEEISNKLH